MSYYKDRYEKMYQPAVQSAKQGPGYDPRQAKRDRQQADWMRTAGNLAPAAGAAAGMGIGALAGGVPGAGIGGMIGGGLGQAAGSLMGGFADQKTSKYDEADAEQAARFALLREMMGQM